MQYQALLFH